MSRNKRYQKFRTGTTVNRFLNSARSPGQQSNIPTGGPIGERRADEASLPTSASPVTSSPPAGVPSETDSLEVGQR